MTETRDPYGYRSWVRSLPTRRRVKPETEWTNYVRKRIQLAFGPNARLVKIKGGLGQETGIADLIGVINGKGVALELKTPGGRHKLSPEQENFLADWSAAGGMAAVIDSQESLEAVIGYLKPQQKGLF